MTGSNNIPLGEVCDIKHGYAFKSQFFAESGEFVVLTPGNFFETGGYRDRGEKTKYYLGEIPEAFVLSNGDVLVAMTEQAVGLLGSSMIVPEANRFLHNQRLGLVQPINGETWNPRFLAHQFNSQTFRDAVQSTASGVKVRHTSPKKLYLINVYLPPLPEQERIVAILDEAFEGIATATAHAERNLHNARELFQSVLQSTFQQKGEDWVEMPLESLCSIKHGFAFKGEFFVSEGDFVCLTPGNFFEEGGYRDRGPKTKFYNGEIPKDFVLSKGDFLIAMTEQAVGLLGSSIIVPESNRFLHNQRLGLVQLKDGVDWENGFFFHQFNTPRFRDAVQATASGAKVRHTSPKKLGAIPVVVPPLKTQKSIVQKLDALATETRRLEAIYERKLAALAELKQSLLQRAFSGKL